jgi:hypothetical protein
MLMKNLFSSLLAILVFSLPSVALAADVEITCFENQKPLVVNTGGRLFDISNFIPGQTEIKTLRVQNTDPNNNCRIYFKGEGVRNDVTDNIFIAFEGVYGNIVDNRATSNKNISDFLLSERVNIADLNPNQTINRVLLVTFNPLSENNTMNQNANFDVRIISEWGNEVTQENNNGEDILGTGDTKKTVSKYTLSNNNIPLGGIGGEQENGEDVKGLQECDTKTKVLGYVYLDSNNNQKIDKREKLLEGVILNIYTIVDEKQISITQSTTDKEGYWETELCQGKYFVEVDRSSLPKNTDIEENIIEIELINSEDFFLDIPIQDERTCLQKYWPWIILLVGLIGTTIIVIADRRKRKPLYKNMEGR